MPCNKCEKRLVEVIQDGVIFNYPFFSACDDCKNKITNDVPIREKGG